MKKLYIASLLPVLSLLMACSNDNKGTSNESEQAPLVADSSAVPASQPTVEITSPASGTDATMAVPVEKGKLNPPHGEPGHRCDIEVGAPLDSKPTVSTPVQPQNTQSPPVNIQSSPQMPAPAPASSGTTAPGMNPPHGEPGHDCSVQVGAPLPRKK